MNGLVSARLQDIGCLACRKDGRGGEPSDQHHPVEGYRIGDDIVMPLCPWHHRGVCDGNPDDFAKRYGPSLHHQKRAFIERYGSERQLLAELQALLQRMAA